MSPFAHHLGLATIACVMGIVAIGFLIDTIRKFKESNDVSEGNEGDGETEMRRVRPKRRR